MEIIKLKTRPRTGSGKSYTRKIRQQGWVPAIYYGGNLTPTSIEIDTKEFAAAVRGRKLTHLFDLGLAEGENASIAVIREFQRHPVIDSFYYHIDFQFVDMTKKVVVECPLELTGVPVGVKDSGGVLGHPVKRLKIECMPVEIPEKITVDVSALEIGDSIHVRDLSIPNVSIKASPDEVIAVVTHPTREEEAPKAAEAAGAAAPAEGAAAAGAAPAAGAAAPKKEKA